jgi:hypothetical protein
VFYVRWAVDDVVCYSPGCWREGGEAEWKLAEDVEAAGVCGIEFLGWRGRLRDFVALTRGAALTGCIKVDKKRVAANASRGDLHVIF